MSNCTTQLAACSADVASLTEQLNDNCTSFCEALVMSECNADFSTNYNLGYHIGAIFVILFASALGTAIPVVSFHVSFIRIRPFIIILGKCMGIGVVLACALVHMILPAHESLTSPCVPYEFNTGYGAYAFLFAMISGLLMQFLDYHVVLYATWRIEKKKRSQVNEKAAKGSIDEQVDVGQSHVGHIHSGHSHNAQGGHSHEAMHGMLIDKVHLKSIEAYMLEFGVSVHSIFIGMTLGIADDSTLNVLLPALVFHQFFEGVALGSRIVDAKFDSRIPEIILISIFALSAPIGIAIGLITRTTADLNGSTFLLVQGIFDSVCGGILLYIGYALLLKDFGEDMELHCRGKKREHLKRYAMFISLWIGAGVMAYIGKYL